MSHHPWANEEAILEAAAALPSPEERAALLDRECAGNPVLRARIESLLKALDQAGPDFLGAPIEITEGADLRLSELSGVANIAGAGRTSTKVTLPPGSYAVGGEIARGGMGTILEAEDCELKRKVAMKVMRLEASASEQARSRFLREATVLARLEHPNIVPIHDLGRDTENRLYYTMKLVQGCTLQDILNGLKARQPEFQSQYTLDRLLTIFRKVCDALALAHSKGVVHRDLKPQNVMVGEFGEVLVMDWGLAKVLGDSQQAAAEARATESPSNLTGDFQELSAEEPPTDVAFTLDGTVMGTPHYMSPEQAGGRVAEIDRQSDVFSLGAILYALLTLHPPVEADSSHEIIELIKRGEIKPPIRFNLPTRMRGEGQSLKDAAVDPKKYQPLPHCPGGVVPVALSAVTMRALAVDKARRYQSVAELAAEIEAFQNGFSTSAERAGLGRQLALLVRRHKGIFTTAASAWLLIIVLAIWFITNLRSKEQRAIAGEAGAKAAEKVAVQEKEVARRSLSRAQINLADAALRELNGPDIRTALRGVPEDLRADTWNYLNAAADTSFARLNEDGAPIKSAVPYPQKPGVFIIADEKQKVYLLDVRTNTRLLEFTPQFSLPGDNSIRMAVSPDGERIALARMDGPGIVIYSATDGRKLEEWTAPTIYHIDYSADGKLFLLVNTKRDHIEVRNVNGGETRWVYNPVGSRGLASARLTPESDRVVTFTPAEGFAIRDALDGKVLKTFDTRERTTITLVMGPRNLAAAACYDGFVHILDLKKGAVSQSFRAHDLQLHGTAFTPGGREVVTLAEETDGRHSILIWDVVTGQRRGALLGGVGGFQAGGYRARFALHPVSGELLVGGSETRVWNASATPAKWTLQPNSYFAVRPTFWGSDDFVLGSANTVRMGLYQLRPDNTDLVWRFPGEEIAWSDVSADSKMAIIVSLEGGKYFAQLYRNPGPNPEEVKKFPINLWPYLVRLSPAGEQIAIIDRKRGSFEVYDTAKGERLRFDQRDIKQIWDLAWLNGGRQLLGQTSLHDKRGRSGSEERIIVWDAANGSILHSIPSPTRLEACAVSPDGKRLAEGGADAVVRIRDAATLTVLKEFRAHDSTITAMAWHPTQPILATASADLTIRLWNFETGKRLEELHWLTHYSLGLTFSPSGRRLACDNTCIWEPPSLAAP